MKQYCTAILGAAILGVVAQAASAAVIYSDDFTGPAGTLNGRAPTVRPGTQTWTASTSTNLGLNGAGQLALTAPTIQLAYLPFSPVAGQKYELSVDLTYAAAGAGTGAMFVGFTSGTLGVNQTFGNEGSAPYMFFRQNGSYEARTLGTSRASALPGNVVVTDTHTLKLVLDATGPTLAVDAFIDGTQLDMDSASPSMSYVYAGAQAISNIGISSNSGTGAAGTWDNFSLVSVPEPAALSLLGLAALGLARRQRQS